MQGLPLKIVLLGSLPKGDLVRKDWIDWKQDYMDAIQQIVPNVEFVHGDSISDNVGPELVVGHDLAQVKSADICVVDARQKVGAGTAQEIVIAKHFEKPVITVIPKNSHYRRSNITFHGALMKEWIHPFLKVSSDYIADSIEDAAKWIKKYAVTPSNFQIKDMAIFEEAIKQWEKN